MKHQLYILPFLWTVCRILSFFLTLLTTLTCNISEIERKKEARQREREAREKEARKQKKAEEKEKRRKEYNAQVEALAAKEEQRKKSEEKKKKKAQAAGGALVFVWYKSFLYINVYTANLIVFHPGKGCFPAGNDAPLK